MALTLALTACGDGGGSSSQRETPTARSAGTEKALSFGTNCKVTIKSDDKFTNAEWNTLCDKVVAKIESEYVSGNPVNKTQFEDEFASANNLKIVLSNSAAYNCEVKVGDKTIYLKTSAIDTVNLKAAVTAMNNDSAYTN